MASSDFSLKIPPRMESVSNYESWKADLMIQSELTDLEAEKRALVVHLRSEGAARIASGELGKAVLGKKRWFGQIIGKIRSVISEGQKYQAVFCIQRVLQCKKG